MNPESKHIAFRVIKGLVGEDRGHFALKYFGAWQVIVLIKKETHDPQLIRETYNQVRRALTKLGFHGTALGKWETKENIDEKGHKRVPRDAHLRY